MKIQKVKFFRIQLLFFIGIFLLCGNATFGQYFIPYGYPHEDYILPPDYYEMEQLDGSFPNGNLNWNAQDCAEQITLDSNSESPYVIEGIFNNEQDPLAPNYPGDHDYDTYVFYIEDSTSLYIEFFRSSFSYTRISLYRTSVEYYNCQESSAGDSLIGTEMFLFNNGNDTYGISPGYYRLEAADSIFDNNIGVVEETIPYQLHIYPELNNGCTQATELVVGTNFEDAESEINLGEGILESFTPCNADTSISRKVQWVKFFIPSDGILFRAKSDNDSLFQPVVEMYESCVAPYRRCFSEFCGIQNDIVGYHNSLNERTIYAKIYSKDETLADSTHVQLSVIEPPVTKLIESDCGRFMYDSTSTFTVEGFPDYAEMTTWEIYLYNEVEFNPTWVYTYVQDSAVFSASQLPYAHSGFTYAVFTADICGISTKFDYDCPCPIWNATAFTAGEITTIGLECSTAHTIIPDTDVQNAQITVPEMILNGADPPCIGQFSAANSTWFEFEAIATNMIITLEPPNVPNYDARIELYDQCQDFLSPDTYIQQSNSESMVMSDLTLGEMYYFRVYDSGGHVAYNPDLSVSVTYNHKTELRAQDCGRMNLGYHDIIRSNWPDNNSFLASDITKWQFKFEELEAPFNTYERLSPNGYNPQFRWRWFTQREPGRTYKVWTRARMLPGNIWSDYGDFCIIGSAPANGMMPENASFTQTSEGVFYQSMSLNLWPNPATNEVNVMLETYPDEESGWLTILDVSGKKLDQQKLGFSSDQSLQMIRYDSGALSTGIYFLQCTTDLRSAMTKLIIE